MLYTIAYPICHCNPRMHKDTYATVAIIGVWTDQSRPRPYIPAVLLLATSMMEFLQYNDVSEVLLLQPVTEHVIRDCAEAANVISKDPKPGSFSLPGAAWGWRR